jgi:hypothetical protein
MVKAKVISDADADAVNDWWDVPFIPGCPEALFCVASGKMIEESAAELVRACDALAKQEWDIHDPTRRPKFASEPFARVYVPMIVTTAKLFLADAEYRKVNLETGQIDDIAITPVPMVRFRKSFDFPQPNYSTSAFAMPEFAELSDRTVLVVSAAYLEKFLCRWDLGLLDEFSKNALFRAP